ncbi:MAG: glucose/sorbosone dehydrogenase-like protein [Thermoleophilia bacterium]|nr:glucose/sorbosone dehydrogenase-like protein [Thermoleophilia bacterium]
MVAPVGESCQHPAMQRTLRRLAALVLVVALAAASALTTASHAGTAPAGPAFRLEQLPGLEFSAPVWVGGAPGSGDTFYVVEQGGTIWSVNGTVRQRFLNLSRITLVSGEQGLLSMAFATDYATSGRFYVYFINRAGNGEVRQYRASRGRVVAGSGRVVITVPLSPPVATNHNGGNLWATRGGLLFLSIGDGGGGGVEVMNSQRMDRLMGKLIRIAPRATGGYVIPRSNPFFGRRGARREIYALGLRNPWRYSIDGATGDIWIGDVGQNEHEEVDRLRAGAPAGANFGWPRMEGNELFSGSVRLASGTRYARPVFDYERPNGECSITGGVVYRGPVQSLRGHYLYTDLCTSTIVAYDPATGRQTTHAGANGIVHFGAVAGGSVLVASVTEGSIFRIVDA